VGPHDLRRRIAEGQHLTTLAFSEIGSRSHRWAPLSTATPLGEDELRPDARKGWVTSAGDADSYVWSSRPTAAAGLMPLCVVPSSAGGLSVDGRFDGLDLRGNASCPVAAEGVVVDISTRLGDDGVGLDLALAHVLPWFLVLNAMFCLGSWRPSWPRSQGRGHRRPWAAGWQAVTDLQAEMDEGRGRRLARLGFPADEAAELSALHTRNFM